MVALGLLLAACPAAGGSVSNQIIGDATDNILIGTAKDNLIDGLGGNDTLYGGGGADTFRFSGSFGLDRIGIDGSPDTHLEASDTLEFIATEALSYSYSGTDVAVTQGSNQVTIYDANVASGAQNVGGRQESRVDFRLQQGTTIYNVIVGTTGNDLVLHTTNPPATTRLLGGSGADLLLGLDGSDRLEGREGTDILLGGAGTDDIQGNEGNDRLIAGAGSDVLYGGGDTNDLDSGGRNDNAQGSDTFLFEAGFGSDNIGAYANSTIYAYGIDASDRLQFTANEALALAWSMNAAGDHTLTITQESNSVTIHGASDATSDGGFRIMWNGITERVDSTTDLMVDGN